jgi:hypothetical protein
MTTQSPVSRSSAIALMSESMAVRREARAKCPSDQCATFSSTGTTRIRMTRRSERIPIGNAMTSVDSHLSRGAGPTFNVSVRLTIMAGYASLALGIGSRRMMQRDAYCEQNTPQAIGDLDSHRLVHDQRHPIHLGSSRHLV